MKNHIDICLFDVLTWVLNGSYRRAAQCVMISKGCLVYFDIRALSNVFSILEGCPMYFDIEGLSNVF